MDLEGVRQDRAQQAPGQVEAIQRQDAAALRVQPEQPAAVPGLRHREQPMAIGTQDQFGRDLEDSAGHGGSVGRLGPGRKSESTLLIEAGLIEAGPIGCLGSP